LRCGIPIREIVRGRYPQDSCDGRRNAVPEALARSSTRDGVALGDDVVGALRRLG
jgi:hypothetical protein